MSSFWPTPEVAKTNAVLLKLSKEYLDKEKEPTKLKWITDPRYHGGKRAVWVNYEKAQELYGNEMGNPQARLDQLFRSRNFKCQFVDAAGEQRVYYHEKYQEGQEVLDPQLKTVNVATAEPNLLPTAFNNAAFSPGLSIAPVKPDKSSVLSGFRLGSDVPPTNAKGSAAFGNQPNQVILEKLDGMRGVLDETNAASLHTQDEVAVLKNDVVEIKDTVRNERGTIINIGADVTSIKATAENGRATVNQTAGDVTAVKATVDGNAADLKWLRNVIKLLSAIVAVILILQIGNSIGIRDMYWEGRQDAIKILAEIKNLKESVQTLSEKIEICKNITEAADEIVGKLIAFREELENEKVFQRNKAYYILILEGLADQFWKLPMVLVSNWLLIFCFVFAARWLYFWI